MALITSGLVYLDKLATYNRDIELLITGPSFTLVSDPVIEAAGWISAFFWR